VPAERDTALDALDVPLWTVEPCEPDVQMVAVASRLLEQPRDGVAAERGLECE